MGCDECPVCLDVTDQTRYLACGHLFCVPCLERLEDREHIRCPVCRLYTFLGPASPGSLPGPSPSLPSRSQGDTSRGEDGSRGERSRGAEVIGRIQVEGSVTAVCTDETRERILVVSDDKLRPIRFYTYTGNCAGAVTCPDVDGEGIGVTMDTKRDLYLLLTSTSLYAFSPEGDWRWTLSDAHAEYNDLSYDHLNDRYVIADGSGVRAAYVDPDRKERGEYEGEGLGTVYSLCVGKPSAPNTTPHIVINDFRFRELVLFSAEMKTLRRIGAGQADLGHLAHVCGVTLDPRGRIIACDSGNRRIIRAGHDGKWETLVGQDHFRFERPHAVYAPTEGPIVVTSYIERGEGCPRKSTVYLINTNCDTN